MLIEELLNIEPEDAVVVERLCRRMGCICEITNPVLRFDYERAKHDPKPRVLVLGRWQHPQTGNRLVVGINLNYLSKDELAQLKTYLPQIMRPSRLKNRWWVGYGLLKGTWLKAYRQYDERFIHTVRHADIGPAPVDFEQPRQPGEPEDKSGGAETVAKLKELEATKKGAPPKEPEKRGVMRLAGDTIKRMVAMIRNKLSRNRQRKQAKDEVGKIPPEIRKDTLDAKSTKDAENKKLQRDVEDRLKKKKEAQKPDETKFNEIDNLEDIEDEHGDRDNPDEPKEGTLRDIDMLIEAVVEPKRLHWKSPNNYIYWHNPERFTEYQPRLRGSVLDYSHGTSLIAVYNIVEDKMVLDLVDHPAEILASTGWTWGDTIRVTCGKEPLVEYDSPRGKVVLEDLKSRDIWRVIRGITD